jgi:V8-like Glu-specific endopeptidase
MAELAQLLVGPAVGAVAEAAFADDDRRRETRTWEYPWRCVCSLLVTPADGPRMVGTGWLAGPRTVITAGHNVFLRKMGGWARRVEVFPGRDTDATPWSRFADPTPWAYASTDLHSVAAWTGPGLEELDYGAVLLPRPVPLGYFGYAAWADGELLPKEVHVYGYPADKGPPKHPRFALWGSARTLQHALPSTLVYDISTFGGQSGCPVFVREGEECYVVGIHNYGDVAVNRATRVTAEVYDNIRAWVSQAAEG